MVARPSWYYNSPEDKDSSNKTLEKALSSTEEQQVQRKSVFIADSQGQVFEEKIIVNGEQLKSKQLIIINPKLRKGLSRSAKKSLAKKYAQNAFNNTRPAKYFGASSLPKGITHNTLINGVQYHVYKKLEHEGIQVPVIAKRFLNQALVQKFIRALQEYWIVWNLKRRRKLGMWKVSKRKINSILNKFPTKFLSILLSPFIVYSLNYFAKASAEVRGQFLKKSFPGSRLLAPRPEEVSIESCKAINYLHKIHWETFKRLNYYPGSTFVLCSPNSRLITDKFFIGAFKSNQIKLEKAFCVVNREYNLFFPSRQLLTLVRELNNHTANGLKSNFTQFQLQTLQYFQQSHIRLDVIPTNLGHTFAIQEKPTLKPLFNRVAQAKMHTPTKKSIRRRLKNRKPVELYQPGMTHLESLKHHLIQADTFSEPRYANYRRKLQYKTSNCLGVMREIIEMYAHAGTIIQIEDEIFDVTFYFNDTYNLQRKLEQFVTYKRAKASAIKTRNLAIDYRLMKALSADIMHLKKGVIMKQPITEHIDAKKLIPEIKYQKPYDPYNPLGRRADHEPIDNTDEYAPIEKPKSRNVRKKLSKAELRERKLLVKHNGILPRFQGAFNKYRKRQLAQNDLTSSPIHLAANLNQALQTPFEIKGMRVRRYAKHSKQQVKLRKRVIKENSAFLKRQLSGYVFPDSTLKNLFDKQAVWKNRWFIRGSSIEDDVYIKITGPPELNQWVFKQVLQLALTPKDTTQTPLPVTGNVEKRGLFGQSKKPMFSTAPPIAEELLPYERPKPWTQQKTPVNMQQMSKPTALESKFPEDKKKGAFHGQTSDDMGIAYIESTEMPRRRFKYKKKDKDVWLNFPEFDEEKKKLKADLYQPFIVEQIEAKNMDSDCTDIVTLDVLEANKRPSPYPQRARALTQVHSENQTHIPAFIGVDSDSDMLQSQTHFDIATGYNTDLNSLTSEQKLRWFDFYNNRYRSRLSIAWSLTDPIVLGQLALCAYFIQGARRIYHNYSDSFWEGLEQFLLTIRFKDLETFKSLEDMVIPTNEININFSDIIGGYDIIQRFLPAILFLRSKRYWFSEVRFLRNRIPIKPKFSWDHMNNQNASRLAEEQLLTQGIEKMVKSYSYSNDFVNTGFLLVGAPGTGKTYLVKALASEADCPIITNTYEKKAGDAYNPEQLAEYQTTTVIKKMFKTAKFRSPAIIFIDEIDSIAHRRSLVLGAKESDMLGPSLYYRRPHVARHQAFSSWQKFNTIKRRVDLYHMEPMFWSVKNPKMSNALLSSRTRKQRFNSSLGYSHPYWDVEYYLAKQESTQKNIDSVTVLLCELDGISQRENVIVIGATNRPDVIDPAITRSGRLGEIVYLDLPNKKKRFELLKYYAGNSSPGAASTKNVDWDFFASHGQTGGLSSAHLKTAMNISTLSLIRQSLEGSKPSIFKREKRMLPAHTNLTIEYGIQSVKFKNLYVIKAALRANHELHQCLFSPSMYALLKQPSRVFITKQLETVESEMTYIVTHIDGVLVEKYVPKTNQPLNGADVSAPKKPEKRKYNPISIKLYKKYYNKLRFLALMVSINQFHSIEQFANFSRVGQEYAIRLFERQNERKYEQLRQRTRDRYGTVMLKADFKKIFQNFDDYSKRVIKFHVFGYCLLSGTSFVLGNPLAYDVKKLYARTAEGYIETPFQHACFLSRHLVNYNIMSNYNSHTLLTPLHNKISNLQSKLLGDELSLQRAAYYNAGKALVIGLLDDDLFDSLILTLWSKVKTLHQTRFTQETFVQSLANQLIARRQFESYLLALIAGKAGEHLLLLSRQADRSELNSRPTLNYSDLGLEELQQMGWLANIMIEKGLYYTIDSAYLNQGVFQTLQNAFNQEQITDLNKSVGKAVGKPIAEFPKQNSLQTPTYWWQSECSYKSNTISFENSQWTIYYKTDNDEKTYNPNDLYEPAVHEASTLNFIQNVGYAQTFYGPSEIENLTNQNQKQNQPTNQINNQQSNVQQTEKITESKQQTDTIQSSTIDKAKSIVTETQGQSVNFNSLNEQTINSLINSADITWNGLASTKVEKMFGQLVFESFNKTFSLIESNRSLFDLLVHEFYVNNRMTGVEAKRIVNRFLNNSKTKPLGFAPLTLILHYYLYSYLIQSTLSQNKHIPNIFALTVTYYYACLFIKPKGNSNLLNCYLLQVEIIFLYCFKMMKLMLFFQWPFLIWPSKPSEIISLNSTLFALDLLILQSQIALLYKLFTFRTTTFFLFLTFTLDL